MKITAQTAEAKAKLSDLSGVMPDDTGRLALYGALLADRLESEIIQPTDFVNACEELLEDLQNGVDSRTGARIESTLVGLLPADYIYLGTCIPEIAAAVFSSDFADGVEALVAVQ